jgi:hypothetical protein
MKSVKIQFNKKTKKERKSWYLYDFWNWLKTMEEKKKFEIFPRSRKWSPWKVFGGQKKTRATRTHNGNTFLRWWYILTREQKWIVTPGDSSVARTFNLKKKKVGNNWRGRNERESRLKHNRPAARYKEKVYKAKAFRNADW